MNIAYTIGNRLKLLREHRKETQNDFAKLMNETQKNLSNWENDHSEPPIKSLILLKEKTGCSWRWLSLNEGSMFDIDEGLANSHIPKDDREWVIHYKAKYEDAAKRIEKCDGEIKDVLMKIAEKK